ncbi:MAG: cupredoxin domain-containing protein [Mycobacterium sp.]
MTLRKHSAAALAAAVLLAGCSASRPAATAGTSMPMASMSVTAPAAPVGGNQVNIDGFAFAPATLTVAAGTTVTWTNRDEEPHTVAASDGSFHSPGMGTGATYTHTFTDAGTYDYVCSIRPMMHGTVVVTR